MRAYERLLRWEPSPVYETNKREDDRYYDYSLRTMFEDATISTAGISDVAYGKTAYINGAKITGVLDDTNPLERVFEYLTPTEDGWKVQSDIEDECNGALDEFLDGFKRKPDQKEVISQDER